MNERHDYKTLGTSEIYNPNALSIPGYTPGIMFVYLGQPSFPHKNHKIINDKITLFNSIQYNADSHKNGYNICGHHDRGHSREINPFKVCDNIRN